MIFCVSIFIFCLESTVTEQPDGNDFRHYYDFFFRNYHSETTCCYVQSSFATITKHFDNGIWNDTLQLKISQTCITIWTNFFLSKYLWMKIGKSARKIIICTIMRVCSSKNIAPRHFTSFHILFHYCMLLFVSNKSSL